MKELFIILLASILIHSNHLYSQNDQEFNEFISKFPMAVLPADFDSKTRKFSDKIESTDLRYICDYVNYSYNTIAQNTPEYYYVCQYDVSDRFYIIVYCLYNRQILKNFQYIITTISKQSNHVISKIVIRSYFPEYHYISGILNKDLSIDLKTIYSYETSPIKLDYENPDYFEINESIEKYQISETGEIYLVDKLSDKNFTAKYGKGVFYEYPEKIPDK
jgi:hypothetical protein